MIRKAFACLLLAAFAQLGAAEAANAPFYQGKTLTFLINFAAGGNADVEFRVYQRFLSNHIPGHPSIVIENLPGAGGLNAMNVLGLNLGRQPDGMTAGFFTMNPIATIIGDPGLRVTLADFAIVSGERGWNVAYGRKDMPPGLRAPVDLAKATGVFAGGYARSSAIDTRIRLALDVLHVPYKVITGFPGTADINKAMLQNEINFASSSIPAFETQVMPQIVKTGVGMPLFQFPVSGRDGSVTGDPDLESAGIPTLEEIYKQAFGREPQGSEWDALMLISSLNTQLQRAVLLPKGAPSAAVAALREGFDGISRDQAFLAEYRRVIRSSADIVSAKDLAPLFNQMKHIDPTLKAVIQKTIGG